MISKHEQEKTRVAEYLLLLSYNVAIMITKWRELRVNSLEVDRLLRCGQPSLMMDLYIDFLTDFIELCQALKHTLRQILSDSLVITRFYQTL